MTDRDRLIELINDCRYMDGHGIDLVEKQADHLLSNGVTVQEWISVDYPPKENGDYFIYTQDGYIGTAYFKYGRWLAGGSVVTHWMPLPQPPKGE